MRVRTEPSRAYASAVLNTCISDSVLLRLTLTAAHSTTRRKYRNALIYVCLCLTSSAFVGPFGFVFFFVLALLKQKFTDLPGRPAHLLRAMCACVRACKCRVLLCPATRKNRMTTTIIIIIIISSQLYHFSISSSAAAVVALGI